MNFWELFAASRENEANVCLSAVAAAAADALAAHVT